MSMTSVPLGTTGGTRSFFGPVLSMSLCSFALVASEFLPVSLLTPIASDLGLSEGQAGQAIAVSGIFAVLTSLSIAGLAHRVDRKRLILLLTALMALSGIAVTFAPGYAVFMAGRAMLGVAIGGYWSMSTAVMMRVVPPTMLPKALAWLQGGTALATAVAAPLGSFLGALIGWRGAFFCVVPLAMFALLWQGLSLPRLAVLPGRSRTTNVFKLLRSAHIVYGMMAVALLFMGQFALFTYLRPFLESVTQVDVSMLSVLLLVVGVSGLVGTMFIGRVLMRSHHGALVLTPIVMAFIAVGLVEFGSSLAVTAVLLAAWGLVATSAPVGWFMWLSKTLPDEAEAGGGLMVAIVQLAITLGATAGGIVFDQGGHRPTFMASAAILVLAAACSVAVRQSRLVRAQPA